MLYTMKRTNIYLEDAQYEALSKVADRESKSVAEVVRTYVDLGLAVADVTYLPKKGLYALPEDVKASISRNNWTKEKTMKLLEDTQGVFTDEDVKHFEKLKKFELKQAKERAKKW